MNKLNQALEERKLTIKELFEDFKKFHTIDYCKEMSQLMWVNEDELILAFKKIERKIKIKKINES